MTSNPTSISTMAGPSRSPTSGTSKEGSGGQSLWNEILGSADRQKGLGRKNVVLLSERHHGRTHLLAQLSQINTKRRKGPGPNGTAGGSGGSSKAQGLRKGLALGYEVVDVNEGDEDSTPPLSIFYPPSSHPSLLRLVPSALPPKSLSDTAVVIVLDWTRPSSMVRELVTWLSWVDQWAPQSAQPGEVEDLRERLQAHIQHYSEPSSSSLAGASATYAGDGEVLPLGPGSLTLNQSGVPIVVVCTKADLMDTVGDSVGMKGGGWEERTDWVQQVLRTICLAHGASLFYTASTQPTAYALLRNYLLHRLYSPPPSTSTSADPKAHAAISRFPFPYRANVLDRDAVMVPAGWDSWGKINVLREGFEPNRVGKAWEVSLGRAKSGDEAEDAAEGLENLWVEMIPDTERGPRPANTHGVLTTAEPEQSFLSRQLDILTKDPNRDPRQSFRHAAATVVGPMGGSEGLNLPAVEKVMAEMEGMEKGEELKEKFARLGRKESSRGTTGPLSPTGSGPSGSGSSSALPNEALHNFFQGLLANRGKTTGTPTQTKTNGADGK
ncbi:hypothetical protein IAR55_006625 [Kwoniella newhampshirensis]|uniref:Dynein light intermediate chain 1, cytosolic n=1 Tax=Kwoniella newhampshirensis TaxID=1651941 RepID=A0AAW0YU55_9TREE